MCPWVKQRKNVPSVDCERTLGAAAVRASEGLPISRPDVFRRPARGRKMRHGRGQRVTSEEGFPQGAHATDYGGNDDTHQYPRKYLTKDTRAEGELSKLWVLKSNRSPHARGESNEGGDPSRYRSFDGCCLGGLGLERTDDGLAAIQDHLHRQRLRVV